MANKKTKISRYDAGQILDKLLQSGKCVSEMDAKVLDNIMYWQPDLYLRFMDKIYNRG